MLNRLVILIILLSPALFPLYPQGQNPVSPVIKFVSVDTASGDVVISWDSLTSPDIQKYIVYEGRTGPDSLAAFALDTLDISETTYVHKESEADSRPVPYTIATLYAEDTSPLADYHYTIFCSAVYDSCNNQMMISWTPYIGWGDDLVSYNIHVRNDDGSKSMIPSLDPDTSYYEYTDIQQNSEYCFIIEAENINFLSTYSNKICINTNRALPPSYINADFATVTADNKILLQFSIDPNRELNNFMLYYGNSPSEIVVPVVEFTDITTNTLTHTYDVFSVEKKSYFQLAAVDLCPEKNPVIKSNTASNIVLQATEENYLVSLEWDDYINWLAGVKYYNVYRITNSFGTEKIDSLSFGSNTYTDNLGRLIDNENLVDDEVCYYIEAEENDDNIYGIKGYSRSNRVCISIEPEIFMANAFTPDGNSYNDKIKPFLTFRPESYFFAVYDRWGSKVFETNNADEYWYGKVNGKKNAPAGVYIYYLKIATSGNIILEKKGTITLFYP